MKIKANGSVFNCRTDGDRGPWVTLSHGLATDMSMWDELTEALSDRYRVLRYDARGHGESAAPAGDYTLDMLVADAVGILDAVGVDQTHFAGLSMGGMITLGMLIDHPARVKSAVIADSRHTTTPEFTKGWLQRAGAVRNGGVEAVVEVDRVPLVECRTHRTEPSRGRTDESHDPPHVSQWLLRLRGRTGAAELRAKAE